MHDFEHTKRHILDRVDLLDMVSQHVRLRRTGNRWVGLCPFHTEKTPSFTVSPERGLFKCFGCGKGGDLFSFVQARENISFGEAYRLLADRAGIDLAPARQSGVSESGGHAINRSTLAKVNAWAVGYFRANLEHETVGRSARDYLEGRGFVGDVIGTFGLGLAVGSGSSLRESARRAGFDDELLVGADLLRRGERGDSYETFRNRLMFPIRDVTGRTIGFGGRTLADDRAKYLNTRQTPLFDKGSHLYGIDTARDAIVKAGRAVVVEGYTDCLAAHQFGFLETVATLGTALTEAQVSLLRRYCEEVVFLFDSDSAGEAAADRAIAVAFPRSIKARLARLPSGQDPGEFLVSCGPEAFSDVLNGAIDALEYKWSRTRARFGGQASSADSRDAMLDFLRVVASAVNSRVVDAIDRGLMVNHVAHLLQIGRAEVDRLLTRLQRSEGRSGRAPASAGTDVRAGARSGSGTASGIVSGRDRLGRDRPRDQEQAAWTHVLEVLLNEPGLMAQTDAPLAFERIADPCDRRIATRVAALFADLGEFALADVLATCDDEADVQRAIALADGGMARGNYEATLRVALERIRAVEQLHGLRQRARAVSLTAIGSGEARGPEANGEAAGSGEAGSGEAGSGEAGSGEAGSGEAGGSETGGGERGTEGLEDVREGFRKHRHFAPRRFLSDGAASPNASAPCAEEDHPKVVEQR